MQEVAVVQRLQTEVAELQVAAVVERGAQALQVELQQLVVEQPACTPRLMNCGKYSA
jgi:hypothetical protein